jgi:glucose uptake protein
VLALTLIASIFVDFDGLNSTTFWYSFYGGLIWAISGWSTFVGTSNLGMAKVFGIWAPMNIVVSVLWGALLFGEFSDVELNASLLWVLAFVIILGVVIAVIGGVILMNFENLVK